jgi:hypothetical protein
MVGRTSVTLACAAALAGCAPAKPQAPQTTVADLLDAIGLRCGEALEAGHGPVVRRLDAKAARPAGQLVKIARRNAQASYLGKSMSQVVDTTASAATSCGLRATARRLKGTSP